MAGAAGGFLIRSFESMLKECTTSKKHATVQKALQEYLDGRKERAKDPSTSEKNQATKIPADTNSPDGSFVADGERKEEILLGTSSTEPSKAGELDAKTPRSNEILTSTLASAGHTLEGPELELVLKPLRLAFETKNVKLVEPALDCIHKLIAYDHLEGDPGLEGVNSGPLFTDMLDMVCGCIDNFSLDSTILQVLKVLLTAVASTKFRVHGECLLGVIRLCYNIALHSKSPINQATSKAMLTQMISIIIRRMESDQSMSSDSIIKRVTKASIPTSGANEETVDTNSEHESSTSQEASNEDQEGKRITLGDALSEDRESSKPYVNVEELEHLAGGADIKGLEAALDKAVHIENGKLMQRGIDLESMSIGEQDALLLFRTLCKMSMKEENDEVAAKTRLLSLELLQSLLEGVSETFTRNFHFIDSVKAYLSYALLRASVSSVSAVFQHATGIFTVLLLRFRESLKGEVGVFFPLIILRPLDSADSPITQKTNVLRMLEKVCKEPQTLADIFVNYDCDLEAPNLYERMVHALSKLAQGSPSGEPNSPNLSQNMSIKASALQCLVSVLKGLADWERLQREPVEISNHKLFDESSGKDNSIDDVKNRDDSGNQFEKAKAHKSTLETAISEFNRKPGKGIDYLISNKLVEKTPSSVAQFLRNTPTLDKVMVGDYLGQHEGFPLSVMHAYVDSMKFSGMKFDAAIREFLKGFRLPGEAQKIDRIMEKFAERYCADNPTLFKNPDTAYVLAYSVIMLNTDAHNPLVASKMSKSDFVRVNTSTDAEECAPKELLEEIYDSIVKEEIKLKDDEVSALESVRLRPGAERGLVNVLNLALPRGKSATDTKKESDDIVKRTQAFFKKQGKKRGIFYTAHQVELARPMLEAVGWPLLAAFSVTMEDSDNKPWVVSCMEGFRAGIHLTYVLGMDTMRYAFLTSLVRFTFLHAPKEMRTKNVEALRTLLALCDVEMESLQDTWNAVLECVSRLDYITSTPSISVTVMHGSNQISKDAVLLSLKELAGKPSDQLFINSVKLPSDSVVEFFTALCGVSAEELKQTPARVFSLQKLVEISYYNMARIRMVWARIWSILSQHFISAGSHREEKVAMYAIDSLRQLGMKYLERAELTNFTFQNDILKPFVILMRSSRNQSIRRLIVDCIVQMTKSKVGSIKSGWRSVFMIFTAASDDDSESIVESAFENVEQVILEHFDQVVGDCFMDCVNCLIGFANNKTSPRISLKAIALLRICEDRLAEGLIPGGALKPVTMGEDAIFDVTEHFWFPMLAGLSDLTSDPRLEVRNCALEVLFDLLNERGQKFSSAFWENIFHRVLFPIFNYIRYTGKDDVTSDDEWLRENSIHSLQLLCNLFNTFYKDVCFMLPSLLGLLLDCAKKADQSVVSLSLGALVHLVEVGGHQFSDDDWDTLLISIRDATYATQPLELLNSLGFEVSKSPRLLSKKSVDTIQKLDLRSAEDGEAEISHFSENEHETSNGSFLTEDSKSFGRSTSSTTVSGKHHGDELSASLAEPEGSPSPSGKVIEQPEVGNLGRSQTFGQRIMGNMMDTLLLKNLTMKPKNRPSDAFVPSSPAKVSDAIDTEPKDEDHPLLETIRGKCITQLLMLGAIDSMQRKYWNKLKISHRVTIMEILLSVLDFSSSYNSFANLRVRINQMPSERPPLNLLRQEITGTGIYLDVLYKATSTETRLGEPVHSIDSILVSSDKDNSRQIKVSKEEEEFCDLAEGKLVSFCEQILKEVSDLQDNRAEATNVDIHSVLELRSPVIVKVLRGMSMMNRRIFKKHLRELYPLITKLVCCDQMDIRGALGDLFNAQLTSLLP